MRKLGFLIIVILSVYLSACSSGPYYDSGYDDGYKAGYIAGAEDDFQNAYSDGYYDGYRDGIKDTKESPSGQKEFWEIEEEASWFAEEKAGLIPYEAGEIVSSYMDGDTSITREEYEEAIRSLYWFYYYFEQNMYE